MKGSKTCFFDLGGSTQPTLRVSQSLADSLSLPLRWSATRDASKS